MVGFHTEIGIDGHLPNQQQQHYSSPSGVHSLVVVVVLETDDSAETE